MYLEHFGLKEAPFRITPHTDFFFKGANRGATLEGLLYAILHDEGIVKVSGEVGSGKTMLCRVLMERLPATVETIYLANPSMSRDEILLAIGDELRLPLEKDRQTRVIRSLQEHLLRLFAEGRRVVALIDEAHAMPEETLEEIRLLSNLESNRHKLLQIVLFGQPELDDHLDSAELRPLKERITHSFRLEPLVRGDIDGYIDFRMRAAGYRGPKVFSSDAIRLIAHHSQGLTRRINILADKALLAAFASGTHAVTATEVRRAVRDSEFYRARSSAQKVRIAAAALVAGLILGWATHMLLAAGETSPPRQAVSAQVPRPQPRVEPVPVSPTPLNPPAPPAAAAKDAAPAPLASATSPPMPAAQTERSPAAPAEGKLARERFDAAQDWLRTTPGERYSIQLATVNSSELAQLESFLQKAANSLPIGEVFVYSVKIDGQQCYRVAYGSYPSATEALNAMKGLPPLLAAYQPYTRSVERMRSQNRQ
jgi:type II secretory pathway predicted ATPase ExeA